MIKGTDCIGVGTGAVILNSEGKLLLAKRGGKANNEEGKWQVPGGTIEFGETFEKTLKREMKEELGIDIVIIEKLGLYDYILPEKKQHWIATSFICKIVHGTPTILEPEKMTGLGWFTLDEAERLELSVLGKADIEELRKKYSQGIVTI